MRNIIVRLPFSLGVLIVAACSSSSADPADDKEKGPALVANDGPPQSVINGEESSVYQNSVVAIYMYTGAGSSRCTGTLVAQNLVLTARHCIGVLTPNGAYTYYDPRYLGISGGPDGRSRIDASERAGQVNVDALVSRTYAPDEFYARHDHYPDVALLVLDRSITWLPIAPLRVQGGARVGEYLTAVGFGFTERGLPQTRMQKRIRVSSLGPVNDYPVEAFTGEFVVAGDSTCFGDSGGPAFSAGSAVVGIVSRGWNGMGNSADQRIEQCMGDATRVVFGDVASYNAFIAAVFATVGATPTPEPPGVF